MQYLTTQINTSATIVGAAGAQINEGAFLAAKFDGDGNIVPCSAKGEAAVGIIIPTNDNAILAGADVDVQVMYMGLWKAGEAFAAGAALTTDARGRAVAAASGDDVLAQALEASAADGNVVSIQITKAGKLA